MVEQAFDFLAYLVPRAEFGIREGFHQCVHDEPSGENDDEPDKYVRQNALPLGYTFPAAGSEILKTAVREQNGGEEYSDIDAYVKDILRDNCDVAYGFASAYPVTARRNNGLREGGLGEDRYRIKERRKRCHEQCRLISHRKYCSTTKNTAYYPHCVGKVQY